MFPNVPALFKLFIGAIGSRLSTDAASIKSIAGDALSLIVQSICTAIVGLIIALFANWKLALIILCVLPCVIAQTYFQSRFVRGFGANANVYSLCTLFRRNPIFV